MTETDTKNTLLRRLPLLILMLVGASLLTSCCSGPAPADVAADRARWTAVRDTTADGAVDAREGPLLAELLVAWDAKLAANEAAAGQPRDARTVVAELLRVYGLAAVQVLVGPDLQARAPELFRLVDKDADGILSEAELLSIDPASPVFALVVTTTVHRLLTEHR